MSDDAVIGYSLDWLGHSEPLTNAEMQRQISAHRADNEGAHEPCPATVLGVLGLPRPATLRCGLLRHHEPPHLYAITWTD